MRSILWIWILITSIPFVFSQGNSYSWVRPDNTYTPGLYLFLIGNQFNVNETLLNATIDARSGGGGGGNPFDQELNRSSNVTHHDLNVTGTLNVSNQSSLHNTVFRGNVTYLNGATALIGLNKAAFCAELAPLACQNFVGYDGGSFEWTKGDGSGLAYIKTNSDEFEIFGTVNATGNVHAGLNLTTHDAQVFNSLNVSNDLVQDADQEHRFHNMSIWYNSSFGGIQIGRFGG